MCAIVGWAGTCRRGQWPQDCADQYSDDTFSEHADANGYEYERNGRLAA
jgi:hypothetical protein